MSLFTALGVSTLYDKAIPKQPSASNEVMPGQTLLPKMFSINVPLFVHLWRRCGDKICLSGSKTVFQNIHRI